MKYIMEYTYFRPIPDCHRECNSIDAETQGDHDSLGGLLYIVCFLIKNKLYHKVAEYQTGVHIFGYAFVSIPCFVIPMFPL